MNKPLILVVEDDPPVRNLITTTLKTNDYRYLSAANGKLRVDYAGGCAFLDGQELHLTPIEFKLLCLLSKNAGKVLTHTFITQNIWGRSWDNDVASLRVFMATLRKKLEAEPDSPQYIQTHIGVGYRMMKVE